jgi:hypothetical protein
MSTTENGRWESVALEPDKALALQPDPDGQHDPAKERIDARSRHTAGACPPRPFHSMSPDPMVRTDRYRLVTPYWDRV